MELEDRLIAAVKAAAGARVAYVCYSGGVDSTVVLAASVRAGIETVALLGVSPSLGATERAEAHWIAEIGARVEEVETNEMELPGIAPTPAIAATTVERALRYRAGAGWTRNLDEVISWELTSATWVSIVPVCRLRWSVASSRHWSMRIRQEGAVAGAVLGSLQRGKPAAPCLASRVPSASKLHRATGADRSGRGVLRRHDVWRARRWTTGGAHRGGA